MSRIEENKKCDIFMFAITVNWGWNLGSVPVIEAVVESKESELHVIIWNALLCMKVFW